MAENTNSKMLELGALWKKESGKGEKYLTGIVNLKSLGFDKDVNLVIFSNRNKTKDSHPDLRIYFSEPRNGGTSRAAAPAAKTAPAAKKAAPAAAATPAPAEDAGLL